MIKKVIKIKKFFFVNFIYFYHRFFIKNVKFEIKKMLIERI